MKQVETVRRRPPLLELFGVVLCGAGICFAVAWGGKLFSKQEVDQEKREAMLEVENVRSNLVAAKIPEDQIAGLMRVQKRTIVGEAVGQRFAILSTLSLLSLIVASFGFSVVLWSRLRTLKREQRAETHELKSD
jgi:hypothetical protein